MRKSINVPKRSYMRACVSDVSDGMNRVTDARVLPFAAGETAYNVAVESGALKNGYGAVTTEIAACFHRVFYYRVYDEDAGAEKGYYLAHNRDDGKIYGGEGMQSQAWQEIEGVTFAAAPLGVNYRLFGEDVYLLCGEEGMAVIDKTLHAVTVPSAPGVTSLAMHNERMFVTIGGRRNAVWFSDDLDPTNWNPELDEGGFIELEGEFGRLNKVVSFGGYVYIFRDYGIARLSAYGEQSSFAVSNLFVAGGRIYADTVALCGNVILFLAEDGLYTFDGLTTARIGRKLDGLLAAKGKPLGCYSAGKYYLSACSAENDGEMPDLLLTVDVRTKAVTVGKGIAVHLFSPVAMPSGELLLAASEQPFLGRVCRCARWHNRPLQKVWRSGMSDLGAPEKRKHVAEVHIDTAHACRVTVATERGEKTFAFAGQTKVQHRRVNLIGTKVQLAVTAQEDIDVARPTLTFRYVS